MYLLRFELSIKYDNIEVFLNKNFIKKIKNFKGFV